MAEERRRGRAETQGERRRAGEGRAQKKEMQRGGEKRGREAQRQEGGNERPDEGRCFGEGQRRQRDRTESARKRQ